MDNSTAHNEPVTGQAPAPPCVMDNDEGEIAERSAAEHIKRTEAVSRLESLLASVPSESVAQLNGFIAAVKE